MLNEIKSNFEKLIALYEAQRERADALAAELEQERAVSDACRKQIDDLNARVNSLELKGAFMSGGDSSSAREKIDKLIKEIDKCISLLEKD